MAELKVQAHWDAEADVWWADSSDIPGLATEAHGFPELIEHIRSIAPILIKENMKHIPGGSTVKIIVEAEEILIPA